MTACTLASGGSSNTCRFAIRGNVCKTRFPSRECRRAMTDNETPSRGLTRMRSPCVPPGAGAASRFSGAIAPPKRHSPIMKLRSRRSCDGNVWFSIRDGACAVEGSSIFMLHLSWLERLFDQGGARAVGGHPLSGDFHGQEIVPGFQAITGLLTAAKEAGCAPRSNCIVLVYFNEPKGSVGHGTIFDGNSPSRVNALNSGRAKNGKRAGQ